jgi:hypothetical protein
MKKGTTGFIFLVFFLYSVFLKLLRFLFDKFIFPNNENYALAAFFL